VDKVKEKELLKKYSKIFAQYKWPPTKTAMCWGLEFGNGWYNLIDKLCENIQHYIDTHKQEQIQATQVKQKFGGLCFYYRPYNKIVDILIQVAMNDSVKTCETCGSTEDVKLTKGWVTPLCKKCMKAYLEKK
jgi:hypothetical protein